jgi:hypothetical protein
MVKLKLSVEELRVESFHTTAPLGSGGGTVRGAEAAGTNQSGCIIASCGATCPISCAPTCPYAGACEDSLDACEGTNASGCVILSCGDTCALSCGGSCPDGCDV